MNKNNLVCYFTDILDELSNSLEDFNIFLNTLEDNDDYVWSDEGYFENGIEIESGASRLVIIPSDEDWVIKIPYGGYDYCKEEVENYKKVKNSMYEDMFAPTFFLMYYNGVKIYIMKKAQTFCDGASIADSLKSRGYSSKDIENISDYTYDSVKELFKSYYSEFIDVDKFFNYLYDNNMGNDAHYGNVGMINGFPVLIDYADYRGVNG